jgi:hypothetical protein
MHVTAVAAAMDVAALPIQLSELMQVALQLFWLLSFFPEPLSMTAQSLIARDATDRQQVISTCWLLVKMAGFMSIGLAALVATCFLFGSYLFTPDQDIIDGVHDLVVPVRIFITQRHLCTLVLRHSISLPHKSLHCCALPQHPVAASAACPPCLRHPCSSCCWTLFWLRPLKCASALCLPGACRRCPLVLAIALAASEDVLQVHCAKRAICTRSVNRCAASMLCYTSSVLC